MRTIKVKALTGEAFRKYGVYQNLFDEKSMKEGSVFPANFFADLITLDFGAGTLPTVSVCHVKKQERNIISFLEAHQYTCEGLLPIDKDVIIFAGLPTRSFSAENLEAFLVPKGTFVKLNPLIVHGTQYLTEEGEAHILCLLPGRTFRNDMISQALEGDDRAEILL